VAKGMFLFLLINYRNCFRQSVQLPDN